MQNDLEAVVIWWFLGTSDSMKCGFLMVFVECICGLLRNAGECRCLVYNFETIAWFTI